MRTNTWITLFWSLGAVSLACYTDRAIVVVTTPDADTPSTPGTAGTSGGGGTTGFAGSGGVVPQGCARVTKIVQDHSCTLSNACHDAKGAAANFSLEGLAFTDIQGWKRRLVGQFPKGGGTSQCGGSNLPYLIAGSAPAAGLLMDKLRNKVPICGDRMPSLPPTLDAAELDCVQRWANALTASDPVLTCTASCAENEYCQLAISGFDALWDCRPRPACAGGVLDCACLQQFPDCANCQEGVNYFRCGGI